MIFIKKLVSNKYFWLCTVVAGLFTWIAPSSLDNSFNTTIPIIIGILIGGLFTTVSLILGTLTSNEVVALDESYQTLVEKNFASLKAHLIFQVVLLLISFFSGYWSSAIMPLLPHIIFEHVTLKQVAIFIQVLTLLLSALSMIEMVLVVIMLYQVRWSLLKKINTERQVKALQTVPSKHQK